MVSPTSFPLLQPLAASETYAAMAQVPKSEYQAKYTAYTEKPSEIDLLITAWRTRNENLASAERPNDGALNLELSTYVRKYIELRKVRDECARIIEVFKQTISCFTSAPQLDLATVLHLQKLGTLDADTTNTLHTTLFVTTLAELNTQKENMEGLHKQLKDKLFLLKKEGESFAYYRAKPGLGGLWSYATGLTPYFDGAITAELGIARMASPAPSPAISPGSGQGVSQPATLEAQPQ